MVTTRAQAKRESSLMTDTEGTSEERPAESDSLKTTEDISATNAPNGEYSEPTKEVETVEQRREEEPTSMPQGLNPLEANAEDIKQWQAMDPTLAKAREKAVNEGSEGDIRVGFYYSDGLFYRVNHVRYAKRVTPNTPLELRWSPCLSLNSHSSE